MFYQPKESLLSNEASSLALKIESMCTLLERVDMILQLIT